jgi:hypothetical protein
MVDLTIINQAATRTGSEPITALTDGTSIAKWAAENYESLIRAELCTGRLKFASKTAALDLLADAPQDTASWAFAYELPNDVLDLRTVMVTSPGVSAASLWMDVAGIGQPIPYELQTRAIFCNFGANYVVFAKYVYRVAEQAFPPDFREGVVQRVEAQCLRVREQHEQAAARDKEAARTLKLAATADAQRQSPRAASVSPTLAARRSSPIAWQQRWPSW